MPKNKRKILSVVCILLTLLFSSIVTGILKKEEASQSGDSIKSPKTSGYWVLPNIIIYNWAATAAVNPWCNGSGTESDPFVIQDVIINGSASDIGIKIQGTIAHFVIKNCTVYNIRGNPGLILLNVRNGNITNNNFHDNMLGIYLRNSNYNVINDNSINNNLHLGIGLIRSNYNNITGNRMIDNGIGCLVVENSIGNVVENNLCQYNYLNYFMDPLGVANLIFILLSPVVIAVFYRQIRKYKNVQEKRSK